MDGGGLAAPSGDDAAQEGRCHEVLPHVPKTAIPTRGMASLRGYGVMGTVLKHQIEAQRSGFDLERRSDGANERWRFSKEKRRRERYIVRDDVAEMEGHGCCGFALHPACLRHSRGAPRG